MIVGYRLVLELNNIADEHWPNSIVIVTHGCGVCQAVTMSQPGNFHHDNGVRVEHCGHVELSRQSTMDGKWILERYQDVSIQQCHSK